MGYDSEDAYSSADTSSSDSSTRKKSSARDYASAAGSALRSYGQDESDRASAISQSIRPVSYKRGGTVRKTGLARLHKGEVVVPRSKVKRVKKALRRAGRKGSGR